MATCPKPSAPAFGMDPKPAPVSSVHREIPMAQLQTLARRFAGLYRGINELQGLLFQHPTLEDWPTLSSRYASLLAQLHNISAALTSASPSFVVSQQSALNKELAIEAKDENLYDGLAVGSLVGTDTYQSGQIAVDGHDDGIHKVPALSALPQVHAVDPTNVLPALSIHPTLPIPEDEKTVALHNALRTRFEPALEGTREQVADQELFRIAEASAGRRGAGASVPQGPANMVMLDQTYGVTSEQQLLTLVKRENDKHDNVARTAQRMWAHIERAPDQWGERYDWKMRVTYDVDEEAAVAEEESQAEGEDEADAEEAPPEEGGEDGAEEGGEGDDGDLSRSPGPGDDGERAGQEPNGDEYVGDAFDESMEDEPNTQAT